MPVPQNLNQWTVGIAKQSAEATSTTTATYDMPVFGGTPIPEQDYDRVLVTDANAVVGDLYKKPGEHGSVDVTIPGYADAMGLPLLGMWPTDTPAGTGTAITKVVSTGTVTSNVATVTTTTAHGFAANDYVIITGCTPAVYNGIWKLASASASTMTIAGFGAPGAITVAGAIIKPPYAHVYSALGGVSAWYQMFSTAFAGSSVLYSKLAACVPTGITFSADENGGPLKVNFKMLGETPSTLASLYTIGTSVALSSGYFTMTGGTIKATPGTANQNPDAVTNVQSFEVSVNRPGTPLATADGTTLSNIGQGRIDFSGSKMKLLWNDWLAYRATYFGSTTGTTASTTLPASSVVFQFIHSVQASWGFQITIPAAVLKASPVQPDPSGTPATIDIDIEPVKPTTGDHIVPLLCNNTATY